MTYEEAVGYLDSLVNYERVHLPQAMREVPLSRMRRLCQRLGDPQRRFRAVVVAGTNGKGSIAAMIYAMLRESRLRAGLYTSPHLEDLRERIRVSPGEDWISEEEFAAAVEQLRPALEGCRRETPDAPPTYFEALTATAFLHFAHRRVEVAVLEVGLGGRLDAVNVVDQAVSVFGPIGADHTDILGDDPAGIAREKAGILKPGQVALTAPQSDGVAAVLRAACEADGVPLWTAGRDLTAAIAQHTLNGLQLTITGLRGVYESLELPLIGRHQALNAALAVGAVEALSGAGIPHGPVERGLARVAWPGRLEVVNEEPLVLLDGAHNAQAAAALRDTLLELCAGRRLHLLVGMSSDKSPEQLGELLGGLSVSVTCTRSRHPRAFDPVELARRLAPCCADVHVMSDPADAYTYLLNAVSGSDAIVVTGSLFLVGELRRALRQSHVRPRKSAVAA
ncbi:MAG: bifunctional folylpolyglutamate synthase/dihydrofolate synthase [Candidatus Omnitrophica bacterium]|nr:bifunctional folylpolyglutamate synthase/dihydrofolate synthase [Candidatus Omnitrophota bacterium]